MANLNNINIFYSLDATEEDKKLLKPIEHILQAPIIQTTDNLLKAFNYWLKISEDMTQEIIEITHMIYIASLVLDDIQDKSSKRSGIPTAHIVYGVPLTISAVFYIILNGMKRIINLHHSELIKVCVDKLLEAIKGQGIEIIWRNDYICPSETDYEKMIEKKTTAFFYLCVSLMQSFSTCDKDFSSLIKTFGLYFQIRDDYCNLCSSDYIEEKGYCEDFTEGKFSLPIIHALQTKLKDEELKDILKQRINNIEVKRRFIKILEECGSFKYTRNVLEKLNAEAKAEINRLGGNPLLMKILDDSQQMKRQSTSIL